MGVVWYFVIAYRFRPGARRRYLLPKGCNRIDRYTIYMLDQRNKQHRKAHDLGEFTHKESGGVHQWELAIEDTGEPHQKRLLWIKLSNDGLEAAVGTHYAGDKFKWVFDGISG